MDSFLEEGNELRAAQEAFCSHFQAGTSLQNRDEGTQPLATRKHRRTITDAKRKAL